MHGQLLAAFKAAAPRLGLSPRLVHAVDWLFRFTQPQDWGRGGRPIVWPSASHAAGGARPVGDAGEGDQPRADRGRADHHEGQPERQALRARATAKGQIIEAYGFDLSPIAARHAEFVRLAEEARAERAEMGRLRRRATIARKGITQILETAAEYGFQGEEWTGLARETRDLARALRRVEQARGDGAWRREPGAAAACGAGTPGKPAVRGRGRSPEAVDSDPLGPENRPHQYTYKPSLNPEQDTVIANEGV